MTFESLPAATFTREQIAIALAHSPLGGGHLGIAFHSAKDGPQVTHLAWHHQLRVESIPAELKTCWICTTMQLPPAASKAVVAVVRAVSKKRPQVNYGVNAIAAKGSFAVNGSYRPPRGSDGLTCATFVVEILRAAGIPLVKYETWQSGPENTAWGERVCEGLVASRVPQDHLDAVRRNIGGMRLRPFEAAAAAMLPPRELPADYDRVQAPAAAAAQALLDFCPIETRA